MDSIRALMVYHLLVVDGCAKVCKRAHVLGFENAAVVAMISSYVTGSILGPSLDLIKIYALHVHSTTKAYNKLHSLLLM